MITTAILFASSHGTTEKVAHLLKDYLKRPVEIVNLRKNPKPDISHFETVIIGGSIHVGSMQRKVKKFIEQNKDILMRKKLGLFICCMFDGEVAQKQFETAFPEELRKVALAKGLFGGEFIFEKMNLLEKLAVKKVNGASSNVSTINLEEIKIFAREINNL